MKKSIVDLACQHAEQLIREFEITSLPVNPVVIAARRDIIVQAKADTAAGISGMLMRVGNRFGIMYATHVANQGFQRFSIAHELGHYFLPGHVDAVIGPQGFHESRAGVLSADRYESEADQFAAGLLMPKHLFKPALDRAGNGLSAIMKLSELCVTSLLATAIRFTQCTRDPVAIIVSTGNVIDYCFMSDELKQLDSIDWLRKRQAVPRGTPTFEFNQSPNNVLQVQRVEGSSDLQDWFGGRRSIEIVEDVIGLGSYGKTLTVLHGFDLPESEEEEDEGALVESWTPRFRR